VLAEWSPAEQLSFSSYVASGFAPNATRLRQAAQSYLSDPMVNYLYDLDSIEANYEAHVRNGTIAPLGQRRGAVGAAGQAPSSNRSRTACPSDDQGTPPGFELGKTISAP
jgi:hypothetical protein